MMHPMPDPRLAGCSFLSLAFTLGGLFHLCRRAGRLRRVPPGADRGREPTLDAPSAISWQLELAEMQNLTQRLSDDYLDIDLLDEQARDVLGYMRADEIVIR